MDKKTIYTLDLKLKRHNFYFKYDDHNNVLTIGKTKNILGGYIKGTSIIIICVFFLTKVAGFGVWTYILSLSLFLIIGIGIVKILNSNKLSKNNIHKKIFSTNSIEMVSKKDSNIYNKEDIKDIVYQIKSLGTTFNGTLSILLNDGSNIKLFTLIEKSKGKESTIFIRKDLHYLSNVLKDHLKI